MADDAKTYPNLKVLRGIRIKGEHVHPGSVIPKSALTEPEWRTFIQGDKPSLVETEASVKDVKPKAEAKAAMPGA